MVEVTAADRAAATIAAWGCVCGRGGYPQSALRQTAPSAEGAKGKSPKKDGLLPPFFVPSRCMSAAALSAAVDTTKLIGDHTHSQAEPTKKKDAPKTPAALRERGAGGEGKDSHSRQWRLSMAVFLNRNKRP